MRGFNVLTETVKFTGEDRAIDFVGEGKAVFSGGRRMTQWRETGGGTWESPLPVGEDGTPLYVEELWVNGRRAVRARCPKVGLSMMTNEVFSVTTNAAGKKAYVERFVVTDPSVRAALARTPISDLGVAQVCVSHLWGFSRRVVRGYDAATGMVETHSPMRQWGWCPWNAHYTYLWVENLRGAFDSAGEWYFDATNAKLCYRPLPGELVETARIVAPTSKLTTLIKFDGDFSKRQYVGDVTFSGISFGYTDVSQPNHISIDKDVDLSAYGRNVPTECWGTQAAVACGGLVSANGAHNVSFRNCVFTHTGGSAVRFAAGCMSNSVVSCSFSDLGAGGLQFGSVFGYSGQVPRKIVQPNRFDSSAFNVVSNCVFKGGGRVNPEGAAVILANCSDSKVVCNTIRDFYYTGVNVGWSWGFKGSVAQRNEIAYNRITDIGQGVMSDMGGIYTLGTSFGTRVHDNYIANVRCSFYGGWGLYCDEGSEGIVLERNLCVNTSDGGFNQNYGTGCIVRNNIFAFNDKKGVIRTDTPFKHDIPCSVHFVNNIVVTRTDSLVGEGVRKVSGVWANNLWYDTRGEGKAVLDKLSWSEWKSCGHESGGLFADPLFVDMDHGDFRVRPESPAFGLGFKLFDVSGVGAKARNTGR